MVWPSSCTCCHCTPSGKLSGRTVRALRGDRAEPAGGVSGRCAGWGKAVSGNRASCGGTVIAFRVQDAHFGFNPCLYALVDFFRGQPGRINGRTKGDSNQARRLDKGIATPAFSRIMRYGNNGRAGTAGQQGATHFVAASRARGGTSSFREQEGPAAFVNALLPDLDDLFKGIPALG